MRESHRPGADGSASERAVSDIIGFVLVFSLVTLIVGAVYISGMGGLEGARSSERLTNAERAFDVLSENMDDVVDTGARSRSTEIKLSNAQLGFGDPVEFEVNMTSDPGTNYTATVRPIVFSIGDTDVVYVNGAVIRSDPGGSVMLHEPTMVSGDRTLIPIVVTRGRSSGIGGSGRVLIRSVEATNDVVRFDDPSGSTYDVEISVTTPRTRAWERYLETRFGTTCSVSGQTVTCGSFSAERVDLQVVKIDVRIS